MLQQWQAFDMHHVQFQKTIEVGIILPISQNSRTEAWGVMESPELLNGKVRTETGLSGSKVMAYCESRLAF